MKKGFVTFGKFLRTTKITATKTGRRCQQHNFGMICKLLEFFEFEFAPLPTYICFSKQCFVKFTIVRNLSNMNQRTVSNLKFSLYFVLYLFRKIKDFPLRFPVTSNTSKARFEIYQQDIHNQPVGEIGIMYFKRSTNHNSLSKL